MSANQVACRIAVLSGGDSPEREISLQSGRAVASALSRAGNSVIEVDPARDGMTALSESSVDVVFPMVHGTGGEDGTLQSALDEMGVCYVGSSPAASALTFDKIHCQRLLHSRGIPVPESVVLPGGALLPEHHQTLKLLGLPLVVKPARQGSSIGINIIEQFSLLRTAVHTAAGFGGDVLVEQFVPGREITIPVIDGIAFPAVEILPAQQWYDYRSKYMDQRTEYRVLQSSETASWSEIAVQACEITGVAGICRVDLRVTPDGDPRVLEINTIPGMTDHSLVPKSAAAVGLSLAQLCEQAIEAARQRRQVHSSDKGAA